jgi:hypothetical protein
MTTEILEPGAEKRKKAGSRQLAAGRRSQLVKGSRGRFGGRAQRAERMAQILAGSRQLAAGSGLVDPSNGRVVDLTRQNTESRGQDAAGRKRRAEVSGQTDRGAEATE